MRPFDLHCTVQPTNCQKPTKKREKKLIFFTKQQPTDSTNNNTEEKKQKKKNKKYQCSLFVHDDVFAPFCSLFYIVPKVSFVFLV